MQAHQLFIHLAKRISVGRGPVCRETIVWFLLKQAPLVLWPAFFAELIDILHKPGPDATQQLLSLGGIVVALMVLFIFANLRYALHMAEWRFGLGRDLRVDMVDRLLRLPLSWHVRNGKGRIQTRLIESVDSITDLPDYYVELILSGLLMFVVAIGFLLWKAPPLLGLAVILVPVSIVVVMVFQNRMERLASIHRRELERLGQHLSDALHLLPMTTAHGNEAEQRQESAQAIGKEYQAAVKVHRVKEALATVTLAAFRIAELVGIVGAVIMATQGWVTLGAVVAFSTYFLQLGMVLQDLTEVAGELYEDQENFQALDEIPESQAIAQESLKPVPDQLTGSVVVDSLTMQYEGAERPALIDLNLCVRAGETLAIIGPSGSGKSTLLNCMLGSLQPQQGRITLDGIGWDEVDQTALRRQVAVVMQEPLLGSGTVRQELERGIGPQSKDSIQQALQLACAEDVVAGLPAGLNTPLGEQAKSLSGGQRQRLAIARALLRQPRLLVLDEPTSALDAESQHMVIDGLKNLMKDRTTLVACHTLPLMLAADRIAVLENGRLTGLGTAEELLETSDYFRRLVQLYEGVPRVCMQRV